MKIAGTNTIEAIFNNVKGDMSKAMDVIVPTFGEVYENIKALNEDKEEEFIQILKEDFNALSEEEKSKGNYIVVDDNSNMDISDFAEVAITGDFNDLLNIPSELRPDLSEYKTDIDNIFSE